MHRVRRTSLATACAAAIVSCNAILGIQPASVDAGVPDASIDTSIEAAGNDSGADASACTANGKFGTPIPLDSLTAPEAEELGDFVSPDGQQFYFARRYFDASFGGAGGDRIYVATPNDSGEFANPFPVAELNAPPVPEGGLWPAGGAPGDLYPAESPDALRMYFFSYRPSGSGGATYFSTRDASGDPWGSPQVCAALAPLGGANAYPVVTSLYFTGAGNPDPEAGGGDIQDIYRAPVSPKGNFGMAEFPIGLNSNARDSYPVPTLDELTIYFASSRSGANLDIYMSRRTRTDEPWGTPVPLPNTINGSDIEVPVYITPDNCTLYFSTTSTSGTWKMFKATRE